MSEQVPQPPSSTPTPDYRVGYLSLTGLAGFFAGCILLFYGSFQFDGKPASVFHEVVYTPSQLAWSCVKDTTSAYETKIGKQRKIVDSLTDKKRDAKTQQSADPLIAQQKLDTSTLEKLYVYKDYYEDLPEVDSLGFDAVNKVLHFQVTPDSIRYWDTLFTKDGYTWVSPLVDYTLKDKTLPLKLQGCTQFSIRKARSDVAFITKYPQAGTWMLLVLVFCSFCFLAFSTALHSANRVNKLFKDQGVPKFNNKNYFLLCLAALVSILISLVIWRLTFYDDDIIKPLYFYRHITQTTSWITIIGCITGACCLGGFVYTASMLSYFSTPLISARKATAQKQLTVDQADADTLRSSQEELLQAQEEQTKQTEVFKKLSAIFQTYFLLSAGLLSLQILYTGALFSTVNSLDFVKMLASDWGYSPARADFIYLYGGLYTIIMLLVYVPAKMRFSEVNLQGIEQTPTKWFEALKNPLGHFSGLLVASSPLLVSIVQSLLDTLFK